MIQQPSNTKRYTLTVEVDTEQLIKAYTGNDDTITHDELPSIDALLAFELNWVASSGIQVQQIEEVQE